MRLAFFGDVVGRSGRTALLKRLPGIREKLSLDFVVVNVENSAGGFGVTNAITDDFLNAGVDVMTTGNHAFRQRDEISLYDRETALLRPLNFPKNNPGRGSGLYQDRQGRNILILHAQGQDFMHPCDDPCTAVDDALGGIQMGRDADAILVDFHAEATSEKYCMGHFLDGRVSLVVGTHTHIPTGDEHIMKGGTAFMCDAGMCGDYDSVIGMDKSEPLTRFMTKIPAGRFSPATGDATLCGVMVVTDDKTGLARQVHAIRTGGRLRELMPPV